MFSMVIGKARFVGTNDPSSTRTVSYVTNCSNNKIDFCINHCNKKQKSNLVEQTITRVNLRVGDYLFLCIIVRFQAMHDFYINTQYFFINAQETNALISVLRKLFLVTVVPSLFTFTYFYSLVDVYLPIFSIMNKIGMSKTKYLLVL